MVLYRARTCRGTLRHCPQMKNWLRPQRNPYPGDLYRKIRLLPLQSACTSSLCPNLHDFQFRGWVPPGYNTTGREMLFSKQRPKVAHGRKLQTYYDLVDRTHSCGQLPIVSLLIRLVTNCLTGESSLSHHKCESHLNCRVDFTLFLKQACLLRSQPFIILA